MMRVFLFLLGLCFLSPALADPAADVLLATEAARNATDDSSRWRAAGELERLADALAPGAAVALAGLILEGIVDGSPASARAWARSGHELGEPDATLLLARLVAEGVGGERSLDAAARYARQAAAAGLPAAGVLVYELLVDERPDVALSYLRDAANLGFAPAQHLLGIHYAAGRDVDRDYSESYFWLLLAHAHGADEAADALDAVGMRLSAAERRELIEVAMEWQVR